jgi:hypothetical protein
MNIAPSALALSALLSANAYAEPGGVSGVSGPGIREGETRIEVRTAAFEGGALDDTWAHRAQIGYGVTDWYRPTLIFRASQPADESAELTSIGIENVFDFTATREWPVNFAGLAEYKFGVHDNADQVEFKLLAEREMGSVTARLNLNAFRTLNDGADWHPAYAGRLTWRTSETFTIGTEVFGEPDGDAHYIGPRATARFGDATLALSYLAGYDDAAAEGQIRLGLEFTP